MSNIKFWSSQRTVQRKSTTDRKSTLSRDGWIDAARELLATHGSDAFQPSVLAAHLDEDVTSFYNSFESSDELAIELVKRSALNCMRDVSSNLTKYNDLCPAVLRLLLTWLNYTPREIEFAERLEHVAKEKIEIGAYLDEVREDAIQVAEKFFLRFGYKSIDAHIRSENLISVDLPRLQLSFAIHSEFETRNDWIRLQCIILTGKQPDEIALKEFSLRENFLRNPVNLADRGVSGIVANRFNRSVN